MLGCLRYSPTPCENLEINRYAVNYNVKEAFKSRIEKIERLVRV